MSELFQIEHHEHELVAGIAPKSQSNEDKTWCSLCDQEILPQTQLCQCSKSPQCLFVCCLTCSKRPLGTISVSVHPHLLRRCSLPNWPEWSCAICGKIFVSGDAFAVRLRCAQCPFDICCDCVESSSIPSSALTSLHPHPLVSYTDSSAPWRCAASILQSTGCHSMTSTASSANNSASSTSTQPNATRWRCLRCSFDFCSTDVSSTLITTTRIALKHSSSHYQSPATTQSAISTAATTSAAATTTQSSPSLTNLTQKLLINHINGRRGTNSALVAMLESTGHIRSQLARKAFSLVDRALFLPEGNSDPYSGNPFTNNGIPRYRLQSCEYYADCLEEMITGISPNVEVSCLVVSPSSGYFVALLSAVFQKGIVCGIDMSEIVIKHARLNSEKWLKSLETQRGFHSASLTVGDIEYQTGNAYQINSKTVGFDRIHVDLDCSHKAARQMGNFLNVGGIMTVSDFRKKKKSSFMVSISFKNKNKISVDGKAFIFERESSVNIHERVTRMDAGLRMKEGGKIIVPLFDREKPTSNVPTINFKSKKVLRREEVGLTNRLKEARRLMEELMLSRGTDGSFRQSHQRNNSKSPEPIIEDLTTSKTVKEAPSVTSNGSPTISETETQQKQQQQQEETISGFLSALGLERYTAKFTEEEITMENITLLTEDDLKAMRLPMGPRRSLTSELARRSAQKQKTKDVSGFSDVEYINAVPTRSVGGGAFGEVFAGLWSGTTPVAMKTLHDQILQEDLLQEVRLLSSLRHLNILQYYGVAIFDKTLYMVMELADGCVLNLLQENGYQLGTQVLLGMALSCSSGMNYLAQKKIVHRDLAARNLLYFREGDNFLVKVGDFGLAKLLLSEYYRIDKNSHNRAFPIKWSSIETLAYKKHTSMSDVWSFGVVLFELFSFGIEPYTGMSPSDIFPFLQAGNRLKPPQNCPKQVSELMNRCMQENPTSRPNFAEICEILSKAISPDQQVLRRSARGSIQLAPGVHYFQSNHFPSVGSISKTPPPPQTQTQSNSTDSTSSSSNSITELNSQPPTGYSALQ